MQNTLAGTEVRVPHTRFFKVNNRGGYVIVQDEVVKDRSIPDVDSFISQQKNISVALRYETSKQNFIPSKENVYVVDTTKGLDYELVEKANLMSENEYRYLRERIKKVVKEKYRQVKRHLA